MLWTSYYAWWPNLLIVLCSQVSRQLRGYLFLIRDKQIERNSNISHKHSQLAVLMPPPPLPSSWSHKMEDKLAPIYIRRTY